MGGRGRPSSFEWRSTPCLQGQRHRMEEWVLVPTDEEAGMVQLVDLVLLEPWPAAAAAAHFSALLVFLVVPFCYLHPSPNHCAAAGDILHAAAAGIGIEGVGSLQV